jgi:hypothetical protein
MKKLITAICLTLPLLAVPSISTAGTKASCTADAKAQGLKGADRKAFMKSCVTPTKSSARGAKMKSCSADFKATGKPGSERKAFMKQCLKK